MKYLQMCPEEEYLAILARAQDYLARLPAEAQKAAKQKLDLLLANASKKRQEASGGKSVKSAMSRIDGRNNEIG